jgi:hypothetical protein
MKESRSRSKSILKNPSKPEEDPETSPKRQARKTVNWGVKELQY